MKVEVVLTSSSRPNFLKQVWSSYEKYICSRNPLKVTFHEDFIKPNLSKKIKRFMEDKVDVFISTNPAKGLGLAMNMLLNRIESKYVLYLQDDCIFEKYVILDDIINVMDDNPKIQQIVFPKKRPMDIRKTGKHMNFNGLDLTVNDGWAFMPHVFRVEFMKSQWNNECKNTKRPETIFGKQLPRKYQKRQSYFLGKPDDDRVINHAGESKSTKGHWK